MIELAPRQLSSLSRWFPAGAPGPATLGEHVLTTGVGHWWADRADQPRVVAVSCAGHVLLRGAPDTLAPEDLVPLANSRIEAPARFVPALGTAFDRITPWERMVWTLQAEPQPCTVPRGVTVRRLEPADTDTLLVLDPDAAWIHASWGGPLGLAASGHAWAAVDRGGQPLAIACTYFRGIHYEDVAVFTAPDHRRHRLALACVRALTADITARGHTPSWNCSTLPRASRLLAWTAGFRLVREYVHHGVGNPVRRNRLAA
jgi:GNAT superfamily N-acetyltransferase